MANVIDPGGPRRGWSREDGSAIKHRRGIARLLFAASAALTVLLIPPAISAEGESTPTCDDHAITLNEGASGDDTITGTHKHDVINALDGTDVVIGQAPTNEGGVDDRICGSAGDDLLLYGDSQQSEEEIVGGNDRIFGGGGRDTILGGVGDDALFGFTGVDQLAGHDGRDLLKTGADDDFGYGGFGNDRILGNGGVDHLYGDQGRDEIRAGEGNDYLQGGPGGGDICDGGPGKDAADPSCETIISAVVPPP
jgi:Ca2+-binding RTX toxin-like protein